MKKTPVTDDDLYRHSSQFRLWSFGKNNFKKKQKEKWQQAFDEMDKQLKEKGIDDLTPLSLEDENDLVRFYASKIHALVTLFGMPSVVRATAISYFQKFYLTNSVMEYHPKNIMYTCVFFASKVENCFISIKDFCARIKGSKEQEILDLEFLVLQSLEFTLQVHNPLTAVHGFFLDMQNVLKDSQQLRALLDKARSLIKDGFLSNAGFFYTPPQVALAALMCDGDEIVKDYLSARYSEEQVIHLMNIGRECLVELKDNQICSNEEAKRIDKKLHSLLNLERYLNKRKADDGSESEAKRQKVEE